MVGFLILLLVMGGLWALLLTIADTAEISRNWPKYRCQASVIPFAAFYGHDTAENFQYCMTQIMGDEAGSVLGPVFGILGGVLGTLGTLMQTANSLRVGFATMMGGINQMFQNFADRFQQIQLKIRMTAMRMKLMMQRLYATFFAVIFIALSANTALQNFSNTFLYSFLDAFCFDPDTQLLVKGKGPTRIEDVQMGDVLEPTGSRVTSKFWFLADGQPMVEFPGPIIVSTNHFLYESDQHLVRADEHGDAQPHQPWSGGTKRPILCLNTSDHVIPIGPYRFLDYDETESADGETMSWIDKHLNARPTTAPYDFPYTTVVDPKTKLRMQNNTIKEAGQIQLGDVLSHGRVIGIVEKEVSEVCQLPSGERVTPGQLYWDVITSTWRRAIHVTSSVKLPQPKIFRSFFIQNTAILETENRTLLRDYLEIHSPLSEQFYAAKVRAGDITGGSRSRAASWATAE